MTRDTRRRVAITGLGPITPIGNGATELWAGVRRGVSAVRPITRFDPSPFSCHVAAEVTFDPLAFMEPKKARRMLHAHVLDTGETLARWLERQR